jgi:hypothetical protein
MTVGPGFQPAAGLLAGVEAHIDSGAARKGGPSLERLAPL